MKNKILFAFTMVAGLIFLLALTATIQATGAKGVSHVSSGPELDDGEINSNQVSKSSTILNHTAEITFTPVCTISLPVVLRNWSPPPPPTPPDDSDLPCLFAVNWWRNDSPPYNIIYSTYSPSCLAATDVTWEPIIDGIGRWTGYQASVERQDKQDFDMDATYIFNYGGGVEGANVVKTYDGGYQYQMEITQFCPTIGTLTGYRVQVNAQEITVGNCP